MLAQVAVCLLLTLCLDLQGHRLRYEHVRCRDPALGGDVQNADRRFLLLGKEDSGSAGIGNLLIFFPAVYYYAVITGRDIIVNDRSIFGAVCRVIQCGFPFLDEVRLAFPSILDNDTVSRIRELKVAEITKYMDHQSYAIPSTLVRANWGITSKSDWWVWHNISSHCVQRITGCILGDIMCAERHAYQRLIRGPFLSDTLLMLDRENRINGIPSIMASAMLRLPRAYTPRIDAAIHLRNQFAHFEASNSIDSEGYRQEVTNWLNSSEKVDVFAAMEMQLRRLVRSIRSNHQIKSSAVSEEGGDVGWDSRGIHPIYVYVASDNEEVKAVLVTELMDNRGLIDAVQFVRLVTRGVYHTKNLKQLKKAKHRNALFDVVFDWYALSLSDYIYAWRKGSSGMPSTFVHSAQKLSGTIDRTDSEKGIGMGTRGLQLVRPAHGGELRFMPFWAYSVVDHL